MTLAPTRPRRGAAPAADLASQVEATLMRFRPQVEEEERLQERRAILAESRIEFAHELSVYPDEWQSKVLETPLGGARVMLNCARQSGKSTITSILCLHVALHEPGSLILVYGPGERQSQEFFTKVLEAYRRLGRPVPARAEQKLSLELENGSRIVALPGIEKTTRGFSGARLVILDEASRIDDELYYAVRPMLAISGGSLMLLSTPFGKRGFFYREWKQADELEAQGKESEWERYEVNAYQVPRYSADFLEQEKTKGDRYFLQEYMCRFMENVDSVFTEEIIRRAFSPAVSAIKLGHQVVESGENVIVPKGPGVSGGIILGGAR